VHPAERKYTARGAGLIHLAEEYRAGIIQDCNPPFKVLAREQTITNNAKGLRQRFDSVFFRADAAPRGRNAVRTQIEAKRLLPHLVVFSPRSACCYTSSCV